MRQQEEHEYWVYMMASTTGTIYVGMTGRLFIRTVNQHKAGEIEGFTKTYHCTRLVYFESYDNAIKAINREKQLKRWRRSKKIALIEGKNPRWKDLSENWGREMVFAGQSMREADQQAERRIKLDRKSKPLSS